MKILILTSGGDSPGMNMVIGTLFKKFKGRLYACRGGFKGLVNNDIVSMREYKPLEVLKESGSIIKCSRCDAFKEKSVFKRALENAKRFNVIVVLGGNGSLKAAHELTKAGLKTIFVPCTIDNDIDGSEYSIGFHTAVKAVCETYKNIMPSFNSFDRCGVFEVMGRDSDKIAKFASITCKPTFLITKLEELKYEEIAKKLLVSKEKGEASSIIIKENLIKLSDFIENLSKFTQNLEIRGVEIGYIQRGYKPTIRELYIARAFARKAIKAIKKEISVKLFIKNEKIVSLEMDTFTK